MRIGATSQGMPLAAPHTGKGLGKDCRPPTLDFGVPELKGNECVLFKLICVW